MSPSPTMTLKDNDATLQSLTWGARWAIAGGFALLAGPLLAAHHLHPATVSQWVFVELLLFAAFGAVGAFLSLANPWILVAAQRLRGREFVDPRWVYALAAPPLLTLAYFAESLAIEWSTMGSTW